MHARFCMSLIILSYDISQLQPELGPSTLYQPYSYLTTKCKSYRYYRLAHTSLWLMQLTHSRDHASYELGIISIMVKSVASQLARLRLMVGPPYLSIQAMQLLKVVSFSTSQQMTTHQGSKSVSMHLVILILLSVAIELVAITSQLYSIVNYMCHTCMHENLIAIQL